MADSLSVANGKKRPGQGRPATLCSYPFLVGAEGRDTVLSVEPLMAILDSSKSTTPLKKILQGPSQTAGLTNSLESYTVLFYVKSLVQQEPRGLFKPQPTTVFLLFHGNSTNPQPSHNSKYKWHFLSCKCEWPISPWTGFILAPPIFNNTKGRFKGTIQESLIFHVIERVFIVQRRQIDITVSKALSLEKGFCLTVFKDLILVQFWCAVIHGDLSPVS